MSSRRSPSPRVNAAKRARAVALWSALVSTHVLATTALPMSLAERTRLSNRVVLAQGFSTQTVVKVGNPRGVRTLTAERVIELWKGEGAAQLEIEQLGGRWGLWESHVPGDAQFTPGETVVLWLRCPAQGTCRLVRLGEGKARVEGGDVQLTDLVTGQRIRKQLRALKAVVVNKPEGSQR